MTYAMTIRDWIALHPVLLCVLLFVAAMIGAVIGIVMIAIVAAGANADRAMEPALAASNDQARLDRVEQARKRAELQETLQSTDASELFV